MVLDSSYRARVPRRARPDGRRREQSFETRMQHFLDQPRRAVAVGQGSLAPVCTSMYEVRTRSFDFHMPTLAVTCHAPWR